MADRLDAFEVLLAGAFSIILNMNDTFALATADAESFDTDDFEAMVPLLVQYGRHALTAYVAVKRGLEPLHCSCNHDGPEYRAARVVVEQLKTEGKILEACVNG